MGWPARVVFVELVRPAAPQAKPAQGGDDRVVLGLCEPPDRSAAGYDGPLERRLSTLEEWVGAQGTREPRLAATRAGRRYDVHVDAESVAR